MKQDCADAFIIEFIKSYLGSGDAEDLAGYLLHSDTAVLTEKIARQGMAAFFYYAVTEGKVHLELPAAVLKRWQSLAAKTALLNTFYEEHSGRLMEELSQRGVRCILLKGFSRMERLYGNTYVRPMVDLDILVRREDYAQAKEYLMESGFEHPVKANFQGTKEEHLAASEAFFNEAQFTRKYKGIVFNLDLHWDVFSLNPDRPLSRHFVMDNYSWRGRTDKQQVGGATVECFSLEMQFIHAVLHFALHHRFCGLKWFMDICLMLKELGAELDWEQIDETVKDPGCRKLFGVTLRLVSDLAGTPAENIPSWQKFWPGGALPGEYSFYRRRLMAADSLVGDYFIQILLPATVKGKLEVLYFILFHREAVRQWRKPGSKGGASVLQPFYILYRLGAELARKCVGKFN